MLASRPQNSDERLQGTTDAELSAALTAPIDTASFPFCESRTEFLRAKDEIERPTHTVLGPSAKEQVLK